LEFIDAESFLGLASDVRKLRPIRALVRDLMRIAAGRSMKGARSELAFSDRSS
jgi:hypothetical protein